MRKIYNYNKLFNKLDDVGVRSRDVELDVPSCFYMSYPAVQPDQSLLKGKLIHPRTRYYKEFNINPYRSLIYLTSITSDDNTSTTMLSSWIKRWWGECNDQSTSTELAAARR